MANPTKGAGKVAVTFNGTAITSYCNKADLDAVLDQIDVTNLASTGAESISAFPKWSINLGGNWDATFDAVIGPEAVTPGTKRTAVIAFTDSASSTVTYTWTSKAEIGNYTITSTPTGAIGWTAVLALSGAPSRS